MSMGWNWYIIALTALNLLGVAWLLWWTSKRRPGDPRPEETSHYWDEDITEYNKPMPRWWITGFFIAIAFGIGYLVWFGGMGSIPGTSGWSSQQEHALAKSAADARLEETFRPYQNVPLPALAGDPVAMQLGRSIFANTCATCHGSSAQGAIGYPNLTDDIWHWGGEPEQVLQTVLDGREGIMPEWGTVLTGMGGENAVDYVIAYVRTLSHPELGVGSDFLAARGKKLYEGVCVACHGIDGKGNQAMGAPDLTDDYWMYGDSKESLYETIAHGRHGIMPAHRELLGETRARLVAAWVWSLSNRSGGDGAAGGAQ
ncbi:cytochrome-c oxidase, cbb3-type subunit III [Lysobacter sp. GX 14042]|uniref:cytochrome-c oxidase, cbb3-type subunit III n=1 Tax=Lysobacter sp. GX 14042 TaxID=2907155 RepID=UPI001F3F7ABC|nr:cytochrome-c oxidase, cbb3-type subunit III [Lysobacter sp. GX 14042]MCE7033100.1 cytochrome-c oxidase, cbb3-type subunit III [Lysobacter sp. GX 14042]